MLVFWSVSVLAGEWQPNPGVRYELTAPPEQPSPATRSENAWVAALIDNLKEGGAKPDAVYRFSRSSATFKINGSPGDRTVFVSRDNPDLFLILDEDDPTYVQFIVNFQAEEVSFAAFGRSVFLPRSRSFCVVILDRESKLAGLPVTGGSENPSFVGRTAAWF